MTVWFISRHPGALHWMKKNQIHFDEHLTHLQSDMIEPGDKVIGSLPVHLAARVCAAGGQYWNLSLELPEQARGKELTAQELDVYEARLERYEVQFFPCITPP